MNVTDLSLSSRSGRFVIGDPCLMDDCLADELGQSEMQQVQFARGGGDYRLRVYRDEGGWSHEVNYHLELVPAGQTAPESGWSEQATLGVDTGTVCLIDRDSLIQHYRGAIIYSDDFFRDYLGGSDPAPYPQADGAFGAIVSSGYGDGGYQLEIVGPPTAARALRIVFIDPEATDTEDADDLDDDD